MGSLSSSDHWLVVARSGIEAIACLLLVFFVVRVVARRRDLSFGAGTSTLLLTLSIGVLAHVLLIIAGLWFPSLSPLEPWLRLTGALVWVVYALGLLRLLPFFRRLPSRMSLHEVRQAYGKHLRNLVERAARDPLTGAYNRAKLDALLKQEIANAAKGRTLSALMIDIDDFKIINDTYGHLLGDKVLKAVVKAINGAVRGQDLVARFGGEEFVVLLPETNAEHALSVANRVVKQVREMTLRERPHIISVTCSIGVAEFAQPESAEEFLERADRGLYVSKSKGKNCATLGTLVDREAPQESGHFVVSGANRPGMSDTTDTADG